MNRFEDSTGIIGQYKDGNLVLEFPINRNIELELFFDVFKKNKASGLYVSSIALRHRGLVSIAIFDTIKSDIIFLGINFSKLNDAEFVSEFLNLETIAVADFPDMPIDISNLKNLKKYYGKYRSDIIIGAENLSVEQVELKELNSLEDLAFNNKSLLNLKILGHKEYDIKSIKRFEKLNRFSLIQSRIGTLEGLGQLDHLEFLELAYIKNIKSICPIVNTQIQELEITNCKSITDLDLLANCSELRKLELVSSGSFKNVQPFAKSSSLEWFVFIDTISVNGDLRSLDNKVWKYINFTDKKHYNRISKDYNPSSSDDIMLNKN